MQSGSFSKIVDSANGVRLVCDWSAVPGTAAQNDTAVTLTVSVKHRILTVGEKAAYIRVGDVGFSFLAPRISTTSLPVGGGEQTTVLKTVTVRVPHDEYGNLTDLELRAEWRYYEGEMTVAEATVDLDPIDRSTRVLTARVIDPDGTNPVLELSATAYVQSAAYMVHFRVQDEMLSVPVGALGSLGGNLWYTPLSGETAAWLISMIPSDRTAMPVIVAVETYRDDTYAEDARIGAISTVVTSMGLSAAYSSPVLSDITLADICERTLAVTADAGAGELLLIEGQSEPVLTFAAEAKNGAYLASYTAVLGDVRAQTDAAADAVTENGTISVGATPGSQNKTLTLTATDSRGLTTEASLPVTVLPYRPISINQWEARRINSVEASTTLIFRGTVSPLSVVHAETGASAALNGFVGATYELKPTSAADWDAPVEIEGVEVSLSGYAYPITALLTLDPEQSFDIRLTVRDRLTERTLIIPVPRGTPLVAFRSGMVGINNNDPTAALDVAGGIKMNGHHVLGVVRTLTPGERPDSVTEAGIYIKSHTGTGADGFPTVLPGILESIPAGGQDLVHRVTVKATGEMLVRTRREGVWGDWIPANGGGEPNVINAITVGGVPVAVTNRTAAIPPVTVGAAGAVKSSDKENRVRAVEGSGEDAGELEVVSLNIRKLTQSEGDVIVLRGRIL